MNIPLKPLVENDEQVEGPSEGLTDLLYPSSILNAEIEAEDCHEQEGEITIEEKSTPISNMIA